MSQTWKTRFAGWWSDLKLWTYKYIGGLVMEEKKDGHLSVSLGRVSFVATLLWIMSFWKEWSTTALEATGAPGETAIAVISTMPPGMMEVFYALASYNFGTKVAGAVKAWKAGP